MENQSQDVLENSEIQSITVEGATQVIYKKINEKIYLKPGEEIPENFWNIIQMSILNNVKAENITIQDVLQCIIVDIRQYVILDSNEIVEILFEIFSPDLNSNNRRDSYLHVISLIIELETLSNEVRQKFRELYSTIKKMSPIAYDYANMSEEFKRKQRLEKVVICGASLGTGFALAKHEKIVDEIAKTCVFLQSIQKKFDSSIQNTIEDEVIRSLPNSKPPKPTPSPPLEKDLKVKPRGSKGTPSSSQEEIRLRRPKGLETGLPINQPLPDHPAPYSKIGSVSGVGEIGQIPRPSASSEVSSEAVNAVGSVIGSGVNNVVGGGVSNAASNAVSSGVDIGACDGCEPGIECFIATAIYGHHNAPQVLALRYFRDTKLMKSFLGKTFVTIYYRFSPPIAEFLKGSPYFSKIVRFSLDILVNFVKE
jgi:hypothetical protein